MDIKSAEKLFDKNSKQILRIFKKVQILEFWLKTKIADTKSKTRQDFEIYQKWLEDKTWNFVINEYLDLYPDKESSRFILKQAMASRNNFMHAIYTWAMFEKAEKIEKIGEDMLQGIEDNIDKALDRLLKD